jgi:Flp pilus assembly pilin Flp
MYRLASLAKSFRDDESGAALVEYAVIFAVLIAGTVTALGLIAPELVNVFTFVSGLIAGIPGLPAAP